MNSSALGSEEPTRPLLAIAGVSDPVEEQKHAAALFVGSVLLGRYRLTEFLGAGGMSRVYAAEDLLATEGDPATSKIAVKLLAPGFIDPPGRFAALAAHVNRLRRFTHPNIVNLFGCDRDGSIAFVIMEFLPGESAYAYMHRGGAETAAPLEAKHARTIVAAAARALQYAHDQGVVHSDLKPGNVMVSPEYGAKVIDFGMSWWQSRTKETVSSDSGLFEATARYASPQLLAGHEPCPADDVFALACVAYELISGVHPFDTQSDPVSTAPPSRDAFTPKEYAALVRALHLERAQRTPTVRDFMSQFSPAPETRSISVWRRVALPVAVVTAVAAFAYWTFARKPHIVPQTRTPGMAVPSKSASPSTLPLQHVFKAGEVIQDCAACPSMTVLPIGEFEQGAAEQDRDAVLLERPQHHVIIMRPFAMSTADVTVDDFRRFVEATGRTMQGCETYDVEWRYRNAASWKDPGFSQTARHPVVCVSFADAAAYAEWLSKTTGQSYRLPTASEWEFAARAGSAEPQPWKSDRAGACVSANVADRSAERRYPGWQVFPCDDGFVYTAPVGTFRSNAFALNDVVGNVMVWTQDCWAPDYAGAPTDGSARAVVGCTEHEVRGGSWFSPPAVVRVSYRNHFNTNYRTSSIGVRLVREIG